MGWSPEAQETFELATNLRGRTIKDIVLQGDVPLDGGPDSDVRVWYVEFTDGYCIQIAGGAGGDFATAEEIPSLPVPDGDLVHGVERRPEGALDDVPFGIPDCTCVGEPGEDPHCTIHGTKAREG